jgi:hypothetical protein
MTSNRLSVSPAGCNASPMHFKREAFSSARLCVWYCASFFTASVAFCSAPQSAGIYLPSVQPAHKENTLFLTIVCANALLKRDSLCAFSWVTSNRFFSAPPRSHIYILLLPNSSINLKNYFLS